MLCNFWDLCICKFILPKKATWNYKEKAGDIMTKILV